jgi:hypothetical protein
MKKKPAVMQGDWEYIEKVAADSRKAILLQLEGLDVVLTFLTLDQ